MSDHDEARDGGKTVAAHAVDRVDTPRTGRAAGKCHEEWGAGIAGAS